MVDNAFTRLQLEHERTLFVFYGYRRIDGSTAGPYLKQAASLREALSDLEANEHIQDGGPLGYLIRDAFLVLEDGDPTIHVELSAFDGGGTADGGD